MALIVRIDVDRPYGRQPLYRHVMSRVSSDFYLPVIPQCGYLRELKTILRQLGDRAARAHAFFRQCTLPDRETLSLLEKGGHVAGLHLEDSRSFESFFAEKEALEKHLGFGIGGFSKHGSGGRKFGRRHYAAYEPEKYSSWAQKAGMKVFMGNLEDPRMEPFQSNGLLTFPSAFWLEPYWRDTSQYPVSWLLEEGPKRDIVLLIHPENVLADAVLTEDFLRLIEKLETKVIS